MWTNGVNSNVGDTIRAAIDLLNRWQGARIRNAEIAEISLELKSAGLGACLSFCLPEIDVSVQSRWLGVRLLFWPLGICQHRRISIVSSRIGTRKDLKTWWFAALRTAVLRADLTTEAFNCVEGTAASDAVRRACELFGAENLMMSVSEDRADSEKELVEWLGSAIAAANANDTVQNSVMVSPEIRLLNFTTSDPAFEEFPARDRLGVLAGQRVIALSVRSGGIVEQLLRYSLNESYVRSPVLITSVVNQRATAVDSSKLIADGAIPWILDECEEPHESQVNAQPVDSADNGSAIAQTMARLGPVAVPSDGPLQEPEKWLCHWTRPCSGPWSGQPSVDFWDELILGCPSADRSAFGTLLRIINQCTIVASQSIRGALKTVSFTAVPLSDFRKRRVFRKHKRRYDFEPYGVAIRKRLVEKRDGRPVEYVKTRDFDATDLPLEFIQPMSSSRKTVDWRREREWRCIGDVSLHEMTKSDVVLFANNGRECDRLSRVSKWPSVVVPS